MVALRIVKVPLAAPETLIIWPFAKPSVSHEPADRVIVVGVRPNVPVAFPSGPMSKLPLTGVPLSRVMVAV